MMMLSEDVMENIIRIVVLIGILAISQVAYSNEERDANTAGVKVVE
jgi:hypothetical protein